MPGKKSDPKGQLPPDTSPAAAESAGAKPPGRSTPKRRTPALLAEHRRTPADQTSSAASTDPRPRARQAAGQRLTAQTSRVTEPHPYAPAAVKALRESLGTSQAVFAHLVGVSKSLVEHWEAGIRTPSSMARRLMDAIRADPQVFLASLTNPTHNAPASTDGPRPTRRQKGGPRA